MEEVVIEFHAMVKQHLVKRLNKYGFVLSEEYPGFVSLVSSKIKLNISFDYSRSKDFEIQIIALFDVNIRPFSIYELREFFIANSEKYKLNIESENDSMAGWMKTSLSILTSNNSRMLGGDESIFNEINYFLHKKDTQYTNKILLQQATEQADVAFRKKNYKIVVEMLAPFRDTLTKTWMQKLKISEERLNI
jgi:hypothetical protein